MKTAPEALQWRAGWLAVGWLILAVLLILALLPQAALNMGELISDKVLHAFAFMLLMLWFAGLFPRRRYLLLFVALLGYGVLMELLQMLVPTRFAELADLAADAIGLGVGWGLALTSLRNWPTWLEARLRRQRNSAIE